MALLDYLGSGTGGGQTMPAAVPGSGRPLSPMMDDVRATAPVPSLPGLMPPGLAGNASPEYQAVTQQDGSILLHIKNADGSLGPAVKIINPIKPREGQV
jgi:hypothetical protein